MMPSRRIHPHVHSPTSMHTYPTVTLYNGYIVSGCYEYYVCPPSPGLRTTVDEYEAIEVTRAYVAPCSAVALTLHLPGD
jgi:hypothetical protein